MGSLFPHCPQGKDNGAMPTLPSQSWSPGLPEKGDVGNYLCPNSSRQSHGGEEGSDPVSQASLVSEPRQKLLSPGQGWVSENAAFPQVCPALLLPHLPCLPLFSSSGSLLIGHCVHPEGSPEVGSLFSPSLGVWSACACLSPDTGAWLRAYPWLLLCCQFINSE